MFIACKAKINSLKNEPSQAAVSATATAYVSCMYFDVASLY